MLDTCQSAVFGRLFNLFTSQNSADHGALLVESIRKGLSEASAEILSHSLGDEWLDFALDSVNKYWAIHQGHLYVAGNPVTPAFVKVGMTGADPEKRISQLNNAAVIGSYICVESWAVHDRYYLERQAHLALKASGIASHKEHFAASWRDVCPKVAAVIDADREAFRANGFTVELPADRK